MFFGLVKALVVLFILNFAYETFMAGMAMDWMLLIGGILYFIFFWLLIVIASVGAKRYRMSRTSWRGIRLHFLGKFSELNGVFESVFGENPPARSALQVSALPLGVRVEVEAVGTK